MLKKSSSGVTGPLRIICAALACALVLTTTLRAQSGPLEDLAKFPRAAVEILHGKKKKDPRHLDVWVADTPARQEQGFMFARAVPPGQGMLFPQEKPRKMSMWMKDTYVELDLVFIGEKGAIERIIEHARPLSLDKLNSDKPVTAVLEIGGGEAQRLDLKVGDRVSWTLTP
ncbi:MAG TPA: DUF192 domain-containing protein [Steroidobacteraceae bacterium]|nr:DUF192 domain-containing protein [Steroidobacteraceae bacterium]